MKETKRQRNLRLLRNQIVRLEAQREAAIKTLVKCEVELPALRRQNRRLTEFMLKLGNRPVSDPGVAKDSRTVPVTHIAEDGSPTDDFVVVHDKASDKPLAGQDDELEIPHYLRRATSLSAPVAAAAYAVANHHNKHATPEQKKLVATEKRKVREEIKQAELTGQRRKMPLTGRDAERALRGRG